MSPLNILWSGRTITTQSFHLPKTLQVCFHWRTLFTRRGKYSLVKYVRRDSIHWQRINLTWHTCKFSSHECVEYNPCIRGAVQGNSLVYSLSCVMVSEWIFRPMNYVWPFLVFWKPLPIPSEIAILTWYSGVNRYWGAIGELLHDTCIIKVMCMKIMSYMYTHTHVYNLFKLCTTERSETNDFTLDGIIGYQRQIVQYLKELSHAVRIIMYIYVLRIL